jgi:rhodanese-related sulfurtransferase
VSELESIDVVEAQRLAEGSALLIDVREQDEWDSGHAPLAVLKPVSEFGQWEPSLPADADVLVMCQAGGRSLRVAQALQQAGHRVVNVDGGMNSWIAAGLPVVRD